MRNRRRSMRSGSVAGALILIVLGFLWLLNNLGYLPPGFWYNIWRFWPVILIIVGLDLALRGFSNWFALPVLLLAVVAIVGAILLVTPSLPTMGTVTESLSQELADLSQARIHLQVDRGILHVGGLGERSDQLIEGQFSHDGSIVIEREFSASSGSGDLKLADRYEAFFPFWFFLKDTRNDWTVELTSRIPLELEVDADDSQLDLNLNDLVLEAVSVELDDCTGEIAVPSSGGRNVSLSLDGSDLTVRIPADVAARVQLQLDDSELSIDSSRFTKISETEYASPEYAETETRLDLMVKAEDSSITVQ